MTDRESASAALAGPEVVRGVFSSDNRGKFSKPFHSNTALGAAFSVKEIFWTNSSRGTVRGMHFQLPPHAIGKLVWVSYGEILDVAVDLRSQGRYGALHSFRLDSNAGDALWVPAGFAHGFQALSNDAIVNYAVDGDFDPETDGGVRWDSIGFSWPLASSEVSSRDRDLPRLRDFDSPF